MITIGEAVAQAGRELKEELWEGQCGITMDLKLGLCSMHGIAQRQ